MATVPEWATKVFDENIVFEIYHWEQSLFDGRKKTFEVAKRQPSAYVLPIIWDRIILTDQKQPWDDASYISFLWGRIERWEEVLEGAKRELLEESWYVAKTWELRFVDDANDKMERKKHYYIARDLEQVGDVHLDGGEDISLVSLTFEELVDIICKREYRDYMGLKMELLQSYKDGTLSDVKRKLFGHF